MEKKLLSTAFVLICLTSPVFAAPADYGFFNGKTVTYIVATKPGGGYDAYGRLIGKYMQKQIPGSTVIIRNVPGAGHIVGANETFFAKPDGLTIGTFNTGLIYAQIVGQPGIRFDLAQYSWIGKANTEERVLIVDKRTPYKSIEDLRGARQAKLASAGVGSAAHQEALIVADALGLNIRVIPGYAGREAEMGMLRGEVDGQLGSYVGLRPFIRAESPRVLLQVSAKKHPELADVPLALDLKVSEKGKKLLVLIATVAELGRLTGAPPNVRPERLEVLREAYKKALNDPELQAEAKKVGLDLDPAYGEEIAKMVKESLSQPADNIALLKKIIKLD